MDWRGLACGRFYTASYAVLPLALGVLDAGFNMPLATGWTFRPKGRSDV